MKFKPSIAFDDFAGSAGSVTASKNRGGKYLKTRIVPLNPRTTYQTAVRASLSKFAKGFAGLTEAQRAVWNEAAKLIPTVNSLGVHSVLSGFNYYLQLNLNLQTIGTDQVAAPPTSPAVFPIIDLHGMNIVDGKSLVHFVEVVVPADLSIVVDLTPPFSLGRASFPSKLRQVIAVDGTGAGVTSIDLSAALIARFGSAFTVGEKRQVSIYLVDSSTGVASSKSTAVRIISTP